MYQFHPLVDVVYSEIHKWLKKQVSNYRNRKPNITIENDPENTAAQFDAYFHSHAFKVQYLLEQEFNSGNFENLLKLNSEILYIDIACGAGASSIAFVNTLLQINKLEKIARPLNIKFIGLDVDIFALEIYRNFLDKLKTKLKPMNIHITYICEPIGVSEGILQVINTLKNQKKNKFPISNAILTQVNAVRPFSDLDIQEYKLRQQVAQNSDDIEKQFLKRLLSSYKLLINELNIDILTMLIVATNEEQWRKEILEVAQLIQDTFPEDNMIVNELSSTDTLLNIHYKNPSASRYKSPNYHTSFYGYVANIYSQDFINDKEWQLLISDNNLKMAWIRSRYYMMRESIVDEFELRLFDASPSENLQKLKRKIEIYLKDIAEAKARLSYPFPKRWKEDKKDIVPRPRVLTRFEEDILAVAVVQVIGQLVDEVEGSYEYRLNNDNEKTEFLYQYYLNGYRAFIAQTINEATRLIDNKKAIILQTDIESFYPNIGQRALIESLTTNPKLSNRFVWLLEELLNKPIPEIDIPYEEYKHRDGYGLLQGGTASGYFAKLYLRLLHKPFGDGKVTFYRYADDMILVIPDKTNADKTLNELKERLIRLDKLSLSEGKTYRYSPADYLTKVQSQDDLESMSIKIQDDILRPLYTMSREYRDFFKEQEEHELWYLYVKRYQELLLKLNIYVPETFLSRKIQENLQPKSVTTRRFPSLDSFLNLLPDEWRDEFMELNENWLNETVFKIREEVYTGLKKSWDFYHKNRDSDEIFARWHLTRIRFYIGRLVYLGFGHCISIVIDAIREPGILQSPRWILDAIVHQGMKLEFLDLLYEIKDRKYITDSYIRAVCARSIRYLTQEFQENYHEFISIFLTQLIYHGTKIECLMATETLIFANKRYTNFDYCQLIKMLDNEDIIAYPQLVRNITIIISLYCDEKTHLLENYDDEVIKDTLKLDHTSLNLMIRSAEPLELKQYYSSEYPDVEDLGDY